MDRVHTLLSVVVIHSALIGCITPEVARFNPQVGQQAIVRDGMPSLISQETDSIVLVQQARTENVGGGRSAYVVGIYNKSGEPKDFRFADIQVAQLRNGAVAKSLKTHSYEKLVTEEKNRQVAVAIFAGLAAGANSMAAANAGYYNANATVYGTHGTSQVRVSGYDPTAAAIARGQANRQNDQMIANAIETGQSNLAQLQLTVLKDNTIFPGEWVGGQIQFDSPDGPDPKTFQLAILVGDDRHDIEVSHVRPAQ